MNVTTLYQCPVCKDKSKIKFKKPSYFSQSVITFACPNCESGAQLLIRKPKGAKPAEVQIAVAGLRLGEPIIQAEIKKREVQMDVQKDVQEERIQG